MAISRATRVISFVIVPAILAIVGGVAMTKYTASIRDTRPYRLLQIAITEAVDSAPRAMPGPMGLDLVTTRTAAYTGPPPPRWRRLMHPDAAIWSRVRTWIGQAAERDPMALRSWLGPGVLVTASTHADTLRITLRQIGFKGTCPFLSTLRAKFTHGARAPHELVSITSSCPQLATT